MNNVAESKLQNFQLGFTNDTNIDWSWEYSQISDTTVDPAWKAQDYIRVTYVHFTSQDVRSKTTLSLDFYIPSTVDGVMGQGSILSLTLPTAWDPVFDQGEEAYAAIDISEVAQDGTKTTLGKNVVSSNGYTIHMSLDSGKSWSEGSSYQLTISDLLTPGKGGAIDMSMYTFILSIAD